MMPGRRVEVLRRRLELSNLDKVLYPQAGFTKAQVLDYYRRIWPWLLPHVRGRPLTLKRYPEGVEGEHFYEKRCPSHKPPWVITAPIRHSEESEVIPYCLIDHLPSLMWVANLASLELHVLLSRAVAPIRPTVVMFDLDPGEPAGLLDCARTALLLRDVLREIGLQSVVKMSGKKGIHFCIPVNTPVTFDQTKDFARTVAQLVEKHNPQAVVSKMSKSLRGGKVFIDWSQNDSHKTTVSPYSLRATVLPQASAPVEWRELEEAIASMDPSRLVFTPEQVIQRLEEKGDLYEPALMLRQRLPGVHPPEVTHPDVWESNRPDRTRRGRRTPRQGEALREYRDKRRFEQTPEPKGEGGNEGPHAQQRFVIHRHSARSLHFDFRLEVAGVLKSWAVPKGPSLDVREKRMAVRTEDHPLEYIEFEGTIPAGQYGAGEVIIWDRGVYRNMEKPGPLTEEEVESGKLGIWLEGTKLIGGFMLVRTRPMKDKEQWLLMKKKDEAADARANPVRTEPYSAVSGLMAEDLETASKETKKARIA